MTTFRDNTEEQRSSEFNISPIRMGLREGDRVRERDIEEVDNHYEDDNPYDEIPAHELGKYVEGDRETTIERDEEEDDIYDEIPRQSPSLSQTSNISKEGMYVHVHDVIRDVERKKERKKERHLRQWKNEKMRVACTTMHLIMYMYSTCIIMLTCLYICTDKLWQ